MPDVNDYMNHRIGILSGIFVVRVYVKGYQIRKMWHFIRSIKMMEPTHQQVNIEVYGFSPSWEDTNSMLQRRNIDRQIRMIVEEVKGRPLKRESWIRECSGQNNHSRRRDKKAIELLRALGSFSIITLGRHLGKIPVGDGIMT